MSDWSCLSRTAAAAAWDDFAANCPDAWLWHTARFLRLGLAWPTGGEMSDASFVVREGDRLAAIVPVPIAAFPGRDGKTARETRCTGWSAPAPALRADLPEDRQRDLWRVIDAEIGRIAAAVGLQRAACFVAATQPVLHAACHSRHPLLELGWEDVSEQEQGIDLTRGLAAVEGNYRKRYARYLRAIRDRVATTIRTEPAMAAEFDALAAIDHAVRDHRSEANRAFISDSLTAGLAFAVRATLDRELAGVLVVLAAKGYAFDYAVAISEPGRVMRVGHALKAAAVRHLAASGVRLYDFGVATFGPTALRLPNPKQLGITEFKRGFANCLLPLYIVEKFYDAEYARRTREERARQRAADRSEPTG